MRVAYICADAGVPVFGRKGCSVHVQEILRALRAHGADIDLFASRLDGPIPPDLRCVHIHELPCIRGGELAKRERKALGANDALLAVLRHSGPFDLIYERYSLWSFAGMEYARETQTPGLLEVNAPLIEEQAAHRGLVNRADAEQVAARVFSTASALLAVSAGVADYLRDAWNAQGRIHVIPNGVDTERFRPGLSPALPRGADTFTVGFVGTLKAWHGLPDLVDSFAQLYAGAPAARLLIVGDGSERNALIEQLERRGVREATHLSGAVPPDLVPHWLASMDVAVAPYPAQLDCYFSPLKVYEYMAAGMPVVASRIGQLADLVRDDVTGLLYPPGRTDALALALNDLRRQPQMRTRLGAAARAAVIRDHTWTGVARKILDVASQARRSAVCLAGLS